MGSISFQKKILPNFLNLIYSILVLLHVYLCDHAIVVGQDPPSKCDTDEIKALNAIRVGLNSPFLNQHWNGSECSSNSQPAWYGIEWLDGRVAGITLEGIGLTGKINVLAMTNLTELTYLSLKNNLIAGNLLDFSNTKKLTHIDLSFNEFNGIIPDSLIDLRYLETLLLDDNKLTGSIPWLNQISLKDFNVSNNNLSGKIPETNVLQAFTISSYSGNPLLCGSPMPTSCEKSKSKLIAGSLWITIFVIVDIIAFFILVLLFYACIKKRRKIGGKEFQGKNMNMDTEAVPAEDKEKKLKFMDKGGATFELNDLLKASAEGLGKGNYGHSFKATLDSGRAVVVKRLTELKPLSSEEFATQMKLISGLKHRNLLPLLAYYHSKDEKLLLYKFAPKGNLFNRIHGGRGDKRIPFKWSSRLSVAHEVAKAMEFLHQNTKASQTVIPHGNLKSINILLDENDVALVSDYGLTSLIAFPVAAQKMIAYKSPEYQNRRKITKKSDVWSYGCLLLELLTGQISTSTAPQGSDDGVDLCSWAYRAVREEWTCEIFDTEILTQRNAGQGMVRLLQLALKCCDKAPDKWPEMAEVAREVEEIKLNDHNDEFSFETSVSTDVSISAV